MRLPRKCSMTRRAEFVRVKSTGQAKAGRFLVLSTLEDASLDGLRTGFITTKKCGKAHERNLMRRRFRFLLQRHGERLIEPKRYLVTIARPGSGKASFESLEQDWLKTAKRLGLLAKPAKRERTGK